MRFLIAAAALFSAVALARAEQSESSAETEYEQSIKPLLREKCYACHGALKQEGGLRLDTAELIRAGGDSGKTVDARTPEASLLWQVMTGSAGFRMPPEGQGTPLTDEELELIRRWIAAGAPGPTDEPPQPSPEQFWSYQPVRRPRLPENGNLSWCRTPIDRFISAGHQAQQLTPQPEAAPEIWLRRVCLDLTGLPPTSGQLRSFLASPTEAAREAVVDRLLASPEYGERWARHWMDVWRYSDWYGSRKINEIRYSQRHIWRWRDWIVSSLNDDTGYDQMLTQMLAGDEIAPLDPRVLPATGFLGRNWYKFDRNVMMFETVEHTAQAFLGLTLRCARCHDHKYDPVSQEDYYRFRAFFEPFDVRTDPTSLTTATEKDATLGPVPVDGIARVFDQHLDQATFVFERGDDRYPRKDTPLNPDVPGALGGIPIDVQPLKLPLASWYPDLSEQRIAERRRLASERVLTARTELDQARATAHQAARELEEFTDRQRLAESAPVRATPFLADQFDQLDDSRWEVLSGHWHVRDGKLVQDQVTSFATLVSRGEHPSSFRCRVRYRTLQPGTYRSVGISFDQIDTGQSQDVYTSTGDTAQSVQAFHREQGKQVYPAAGIVKTRLEVGAETTLEFEVRDRQLVVWLNGQQKLEYTIPTPRRSGRIALWVHAGAAEFDEIEITPLTPSARDYQRAALAARQQVERRTAELAIAESEQQSWESRIAAELARHTAADSGSIDALAVAAARAALHVELAQQRLKLIEAQHAGQLLSVETPPDEESPSSEAVREAQARVDEIQASLQQLQSRLESPGTDYPELGPTFPPESSGRRSALARWMTDPSNPRTARVAVNYVWMWHFGQPLVATTDNFGMNGQLPGNPELLDWLAAELMHQDWKLKPLHRQIVLSATYRMASSSANAHQRNLQQDPENRFLWRMPERRMDAETVRDSVLAISGALERQLGGVEIAETLGEQSYRRSLYFRNTPNEKMPLLETFDMANPNQCYRRQQSIVPQQALALLNSRLVLEQSRRLAARLARQVAAANPAEADEDRDERFVRAAFASVLSRPPRDAELSACRRFLSEQAARPQDFGGPHYAGQGGVSVTASDDPSQRARENLVHVLFSHHEFVTIR